MDVTVAPVKRTHILRVPVDAFSKDDLGSIIDDLREQDGRHHIVMLTTEGLMRARRNALYRKTLHEASLVVPISLGLQRAATFLERPSVEAQTTFRFVIRLLGLLEERGATYYLLGLRRRHLTRVEENLRLTFPGLRLVGRHPGYYSQDRESDIVTAIRKASPNLVLIGSGIRGGDSWVRSNKRTFAPGIYLWVPEVLEVFADVRRKPPATRAGRVLRRFRGVLSHPWRLGKAFLFLWFGILLLFARIFGK
jgi:N-acetylglucosaminyldiphosphoundecaprenol N-acetyl-beta-D-mannosaminyltransferase